VPASPTFYTLGHVALPQQRGTGALNLRVFTGGDESITTPRLQWPNGQDHLVGRGTEFGQPISDSVCQVHLKLTVLGEAALARLRGKIHRGSRSAVATQDLHLTHDFVGLHRIGQERVRLAMVWAALRGGRAWDAEIRFGGKDLRSFPQILSTASEFCCEPLLTCHGRTRYRRLVLV